MPGRAAAAPDEDVLVRFQGVQKSYDGVSLVIKTLDLDVRKGEFLTLLGPSGSGKTTCLMMLAGFETTTGGQILLEGRRIDTTPPHRRNIGMVFQNYALFPHLTVEENLAFPLKVRRRPSEDIRHRVGAALEMVSLEGFADRMPAQLSGGQQQRVAVARALVFEPRLVLMDEPLGALDKNLREQMQMEIRHIHERLGVTVVYVTHDQAEALTMSTRIAVFHDGMIQQIDTPSALYERPANSFVASFIGENNCLPARVETLNGERCRLCLPDGSRVEARPVELKAAGETATLSLRPERVAVGEAAASCVNRFEGVVLERIYLGDHLRMRIRLFGEDRFIVKLPNAGPRPAPQQGERIVLGWSAEDGRALKA